MYYSNGAIFFYEAIRYMHLMRQLYTQNKIKKRNEMKCIFIKSKSVRLIQASFNAKAFNFIMFPSRRIIE
jgi:hypothetical protein